MNGSRLDVYFHLHPEDAGAAAPAWAQPLIDALSQLTQGQSTMATELDNLTAQVAASTTVQDSAMVLLQGLKTALDAAIASGGGPPPKALQALSDSLGAEAAKLAAAITANTPAAAGGGPTPPGGTPPGGGPSPAAR